MCALEYRGRTYTEPVEVDCRLASLSGGVSVTGRYAVLRATLEPDQRRGSTAAEVVPTETPQPSAMPLWRPAVPSRHCATCRQCGAAAVDSRFHRALPLPSENWREMLGNIFCHGDGADRNIHERVRARPGDCFYSASHVVLSAEDIECDVSDSRLSCAGCSAPLGEKVEFGARLWHHRLTWSQHGVQQLRLEPGQVLRRLLVHGADMCDAPAARLLASAPRHEPLLMWLVDTSLTVHVISPGKDDDDDPAAGGRSQRTAANGDGNNGTNGATGHGKASNGNATNGTTGHGKASNGNATDGTTGHGKASNGSNGSSNGTATMEEGSGAGDKAGSKVQTKKPPGRSRTAVKILYRRCDDEAARQHRADLAVKSLELDEALMAALRAELERSQRWYPELQRTQGEDQVGLIIL